LSCILPGQRFTEERFDAGEITPSHVGPRPNVRLAGSACCESPAWRHSVRTMRVDDQRFGNRLVMSLAQDVAYPVGWAPGRGMGHLDEPVSAEPYDRP
jgi:hypothetical protein